MQTLGSMNTSAIKRTIAANAAEVARLHARIHETLRSRGKSEKERAAWQEACAEFHARYDALAFPGGYQAGLAGISSGDPAAVEVGLCFLELRPYFFRSGYMYNVLLRRIKRATLPPEQFARFQAVLERQVQWRTLKAKHAAA
jgi:hypothetical protein